MEKKEVKVKITDEVLKGAYANQMVVTHTKEEFVLDFINAFPPTPLVTARIVTSPGHLKRIIAALQENLGKYEATHGKVAAAPAPPAGKGFILQ